MRGPGSGPPRRSHTKSRKGCETCKRRHIRCDENFPQCRNCTKHKIRCPYNDAPPPDDGNGSPDKPDLMWTPAIEADIARWQQTGEFPFPSLNIYPTPATHLLTTEELRLIHHVASITHQLATIDANGFTLWTRQMPTIIRIGATHRYVLESLLAFSAMHIAFLTDCPVIGNMAYEHRGKALKGLHEAIGSFSRESSDAILAASLALSWQATDWRSWTQLMQGTSTVIDAMEPWKLESQFGDFMAESSTFPTAPASPAPDHTPSQPRKEDLDAFQHAMQQLHKLEAHFKQHHEDHKSIQQLISFLKGSRKVFPSLSVSQQFERLRPLRTWLFWLPVMYLQQTGGTPNALVIIAHYYTVALLMERLFPEIGAAYFGSMTIGPVEEIARRLLSLNIAGSMEGDVQTPLALMEYPIDTVNEFRSRMGWVQPVRTPSFPHFPPSAYMSATSPTSHPTSSPGQPVGYSPYPENPAFCYSTEELSIVTNAKTNSPLPLSPYSHSHYLSIPSPSYAAYSPTSSTFNNDFGDSSSLTYSDREDYSPYDLGLSPSTPVMGSNIYGLGISSKTLSPTSDVNLALPPRLPSIASLAPASSPSWSSPTSPLLPCPSTPADVTSCQHPRHSTFPTSVPAFEARDDRGKGVVV